MTIRRGIISMVLLLGVFSCSLLGQESWQGRSEASRMHEWRQKLMKYPVGQGAIQLEKIGTFPSPGDENKGDYLWNAERMGGDRTGEIIVADKRACKIFVFSSAGRIEYKWGRRGQGPGEFQNPYSLAVNGKSLVISDTKNMMLSFFDFSGKFLRGLKMFKAYYDIALNQEGDLYAAPLRTTKEAPLIDVLDENGKLINSFGQPLQDAGEDWLLSNFLIIDLNEDGELLVAYQHHPVVNRYSKSGHLIGTFHINHNIMKDDDGYNQKRSIRDGILRVIYAIRAARDGFFVLHSYPRIEIMQFNYRGELINDYYFEEGYDSLFADLVVRTDNGHKVFYVLQTSPRNEIIALRPKQIP